MQKLKYTNQNIYNILNDNPYAVDWKKKTFFMGETGQQIAIRKEKKAQTNLNKQKKTYQDLRCISCDKSINNLSKKDKFDIKFYNKYKMCFECAIDLQTKFRFLNMWQAYQKSNMLANMISVTRDSIQWYEQLKGKTKWQQLVNSYGQTQKMQIPNEQQYIKQIEYIIDQLIKYRKTLIQQYLNNSKIFIEKFDLNQQQGKIDSYIKCPINRNLDPNQFNIKYQYSKNIQNTGDDMKNEKIEEKSG